MTRDGFESETPSAEFDLKRLAEISGGDGEFEREIAGEYVSQSRTLLDDLSRAIESGDPSALRRTAHTLKGSSRTIGAQGVAGLAAQIERLDPTTNAEAAAAVLGRARASLSVVEQTLDGYFGSDEYRRAA